MELERFVQQLRSLLPNLSPSPGSVLRARPPLSRTSTGLTDREREVLCLLASGASTKVIAQQLFVSTSTVRVHIENILAKLGVHSRLEAVTLCIRNDLI